tara:strand:- start:595 stop:912 length:318 start_codon:yes stop_codon:yes gene_type:complete
MSNSDRPINPSEFTFENQLGHTIHEMNTGLTKREHFASLAPDNIPQWFYQVFAETADPKLTWHRESNDFQIGECGLTQEGEITLYFAWRTYYADELLKQLENKGG